MIYINMNAWRIDPRQVPVIGFSGENRVQTLGIITDDDLTGYDVLTMETGDQICYLTQSGDEKAAYEVTLTAEALGISGIKEGQIVCSNSETGETRKSNIFYMIVDKSLNVKMNYVTVPAEFLELESRMRKILAECGEQAAAAVARWVEENGPFESEAAAAAEHEAIRAEKQPRSDQLTQAAEALEGGQDGQVLGIQGGAVTMVKTTGEQADWEAWREDDPAYIKNKPFGVFVTSGLTIYDLGGQGSTVPVTVATEELTFTTGWDELREMTVTFQTGGEKREYPIKWEYCSLPEYGGQSWLIAGNYEMAGDTEHTLDNEKYKDYPFGIRYAVYMNRVEVIAVPWWDSLERVWLKIPTGTYTYEKTINPRYVDAYTKAEIDEMLGGVSAKVTQTDAGAVVEITDKDGTTTATIKNGDQGPKGDAYTITEADYQAIADKVLADIDGTADKY